MVGGSIPLQVSMVWVCPLGEMSGNDIAMSGGEMWAVSPIPCFIGSVASIGGRFYSLAGFNGLGVSLVAVLFPSRCQWFGCVPSVRCRAVFPLPCFIGSVASSGGRLYSLAGVNGLGVSPR